MKKDLFRHELNHLLVSTYQTIEKAEQKSINKEQYRHSKKHKSNNSMSTKTIQITKKTLKSKSQNHQNKR